MEENKTMANMKNKSLLFLVIMFCVFIFLPAKVSHRECFKILANNRFLRRL